MSSSPIDISGSGLGEVAVYMSVGDRLSGGVMGVVGGGASPGVELEADRGGGAEGGSWGSARSIA